MTHPPLSGWSLDDRDQKTIQTWLTQCQWFYKHYFQAETDGWENIPETGAALIVGSHNGGLACPDMMISLYDWFRHFGTERLVYGLMHPHVWEVYSPLAKIASQLGAIRANPRLAISALERGACVLVYPGGGPDVFRPYWERDQIKFCGRKGFIKLALRENVSIVPVISWGAHDTLFVLADIYEPMKWFLETFKLPWLFNLDPEVFPIYLGLPWGISFGPLMNFPLPAKVRVRVCPPIQFERYGREATQDSDYVQYCYDTVVQEMQTHLNQLIKEADY
ncbi:lysophospholipid acyltransferase family protein [Dactylococcopsis salina]|uniref:1-acyl-sn-glycerol-3-phosphate acyltransferase n=1 Tax=Dactylococcopsis salina (strain PCC 8305) TaxID=13035 RepID=K9YX80_DACS8|nr:lysophospholipid acyltransferase family protein [Dactylococcopsis salina]AFZ50935.1 1-acyl-sn-glycerol-3-phosphate acyltransferase [Dactylococcopsis salina PCC 8305]